MERDAALPCRYDAGSVDLSHAVLQRGVEADADMEQS